MTEKAYLGDGAYVHMDFNGVKITTENGMYVTNKVYLETEAIAALINFCKRHPPLWDRIEKMV